MVERRGAPDLVVQSRRNSGVRLARLRGGDGRVLWDVVTSGDASRDRFVDVPPHCFADLDGDGGLDALIALPDGDITGPRRTVAAVSLRDGRRLWAQEVAARPGFDVLGDLRVGDVDADGRPDVVAIEGFGDLEDKIDIGVRVFAGRDGALRWRWKPGMARSIAPETQAITLANFEGRGISSVCVACVAATPSGLERRVVVLDRDGTERVQRHVALSDKSRFGAADLDGDGKDELVGMVVERGSLESRVCAWDRDLRELWAWPPRTNAVAGRTFVFEDARPGLVRSGTIERILPASSGRAGQVIVTPGLALDGATYRPLCTGQAALLSSAKPNGQEPDFAPKLLDAGDGSGGGVRLIAHGLGATVSRLAMPTDAEGRIAAAQGRLWVDAGGVAPDPRWMRPLPWTRRLHGFFGPGAFLAAGGLALVNVVLPLLGLWLVVGRRRVFRVWALMAVPVAAALPLMVYQSLAPWLPVGEQVWLATPWRVFLLGTLAGVPVVLGGWWVVAAVVRGRWRRVLAMVGLVVVATLLVALGWTWVDRKSMDVNLEHYDWEGWGLGFLVGGYLAAVVWGVGLVVAGVRGWSRRLNGGGRR